MKKSGLVIAAFLFVAVWMHAQKTTVLTSNLNMSKSNINRMAYDNTILTTAQGEALLLQAEQSGIRDAAKMKQWLASNFKRMGIAEEKIKVFDIYFGRESSSCEDCRKNCKGRCVWEGKEGCMCFYTSEPNLRLAAPQPMLIVLLTDPLQEEKVFMKSGGKGTIKSD